MSDPQQSSDSRLMFDGAPRNAPTSGGYPAYPASPSPAGRDFSDYLRIAYRHRWLAVAGFVAVATPIVVWTMLQVPIYEAHTRLLLAAEPPVAAPFRDSTREQPGPDLMQTQQQILRSRLVALRTVERLQLWNHPEFDGTQSSSPSTRLRLWLKGSPSPAPQQSDSRGDGPAQGNAEDPRAAALADAFLERVSVTPVPLSRIVDVSFESADPVLAANAANAVADEFIRQDVESRFSDARGTTTWLEQRLAEQRTKVEESEARLQKFKEERDAFAVEERQNIIVQSLGDINAAATRARTTRLEKEGIYRQVEGLEAGSAELDSVPLIAADPTIRELRAELGSLEREHAELSQKYGERHPEMVKIRTSIDATRGRLQAEIAKTVDVARNEYLAALAQERRLFAALQGQKSETLRLNEKNLEYGRLEREAAANRKIYDALLQQAQQAGISSELKQSSIRIVDRAEVPGVPVRPARAKNTLLAICAGLFAALGLVLVRDFLDPRIKTPDDVRTGLRLPLLGLVPSFKVADRDKVPLFGSVTDPSFSEALRRIRSNLLLSAPQTGPKSLLVTSSAPAEGKTTIAVGLAMAFAAAGRRTLLIDADLRRPGAHRRLIPDAHPGLADFLTGGTDVPDVVHSTRIKNLWVIPCGTHAESPSELLGLPRMAGLLETQEPQFDWIIIDSAPVMAVSDPALIARLATGLLFVIGAEMTPRRVAMAAVEQLMLAKARFAGAVLTRTPVAKHGYYYSPYYSRHYESYYTRKPSAGRGVRSPDEAARNNGVLRSFASWWHRSPLR